MQSLPDRDVYVVAAEAATAVLHSRVPHHAAMLAHFDWFIAAVDAAVRESQRVGCDICAADRLVPTPIAILPPAVLKQAAVR